MQVGGSPIPVSSMPGAKLEEMQTYITRGAALTTMQKVWMEKVWKDLPISKEYKICGVRREVGSQRCSMTTAVKGGCETNPTPALCGSCLL